MNSSVQQPQTAFGNAYAAIGTYGPCDAGPLRIVDPAETVDAEYARQTPYGSSAILEQAAKIIQVAQPLIV